MKQLNAMGNRRHYYRNSSAVANRIATNQAQQQAPNPAQQQQQQQIPSQMNLQHNQNLVNRDQYDMSVGMDMAMPGMSQGTMNQGYMHQGKVPYNMYLF